MAKDKKKYRHSSSYYRKCKANMKIQSEILKEEQKCELPSKSSFHEYSTLCQSTDSTDTDTVSMTHTGKDLDYMDSYYNELGNKISDNIDDMRDGNEIGANKESENEDSGDEYIRNEDCSDMKSIKLMEDLIKWTVQHKPTNSSLNDLLVLLTEYGFKLPKDGRALLKTDDVFIEPMGQGKFWYQGVSSCLQKTLSNMDLSTISSIELMFNVDGMSLFNSTASEVWPIAMAIYDMPNIKPMFPAIYYGSGKPPLEVYLRQFINEMNKIIDEGIIINEKKMLIKIKCFICDTPARAYLKGTPNFNATKSSCIKCTVEGVWDKKGRHMSYPMFQCPRRTDASFRSKLDEDHHVHETPLVELPIDMIEDFIVADSLHLLDLGVMRKCLMSWCNGSFNFKSKLRGSDIELLNNMLQDCEKNRPIEIQRNIRGVKYLKYWKGTEYRVMLLYLGIIVLKDILISEVYEHFLLLSCAATILSCKTYLVYVNIAKRLLDEYLEGCINLYGLDSISSNFHNLCHVIDDVQKFGALSGISAYQFENSLGQLKSLVRSGKQPLKQIALWVTRISNAANKSDDDQEVCLKGKTEDGSYKKIYFKDFMLGGHDKNSWFLTKENDIVKLQKITLQAEKNYKIIGKQLDSKQDFFTLPFKSSKLNIFSTDESMSKDLQHKQVLKEYNVAEIKCKLFHLRYKEKSVFLPLLHTLDSINNYKLENNHNP